MRHDRTSSLRGVGPLQLYPHERQYQLKRGAAPDLYDALIAVRDDLLMRSELVRGEKVVACGAGVWVRLNDAIAKAEGRAR